LKGGNNTGTAGELFARAIGRTLDALSDRAVVFVQQVPEQDVKVPNAYVVLNRLGRSLQDVSVDRARHDRLQGATSAALQQISSRANTLLIDPDDLLCRGDKCIVEADGKILYWDHHHLNADGSLLMYPLIERGLAALARKTGRLAGD
jgi:hypothetical protein